MILKTDDRYQFMVSKIKMVALEVDLLEMKEACQLLIWLYTPIIPLF